MSHNDPRNSVDATCVQRRCCSAPSPRRLLSGADSTTASARRAASASSLRSSAAEIVVRAPISPSAIRVRHRGRRAGFRRRYHPFRSPRATALAFSRRRGQNSRPSPFAPVRPRAQTTNPSVQRAPAVPRGRCRQATEVAAITRGHRKLGRRGRPRPQSPRPLRSRSLAAEAPKGGTVTVRASPDIYAPDFLVPRIPPPSGGRRGPPAGRPTSCRATTVAAVAGAPRLASLRPSCRSSHHRACSSEPARRRRASAALRARRCRDRAPSASSCDRRSLCREARESS